MIYLFTGVPGSGKTLNVVSMLAKRKDFQGRPLFIDGIPDLKIPHEPIPEGESIKTWPKWAPTGAIIVVDECQRIFPRRASTAAVPDYISEFETHRHRGLDFLLIAQHPKLLDNHLRVLIEHHTHFSGTSLGIRRKLEWSTGGAKDPESRANIKDALVSVYKLDKSVYGLYKSAEEHTKIKTARSKVFYLIPVFLLLLIYGGWAFYNFWGEFEKPVQIKTAQAKGQAGTIAAPAASPEAGGTAAAPAADVTHAAGQYAPEVKQADRPHISADDFRPAIDGQPHTAPIYDTYNKAVQTMPYPAACIKNADRCTCYTDQGTKIKGFDKQLCLEYVADGLYNPYRRQTAENQAQTASPAPAPSEHSEVLALTGRDKYETSKFSDGPPAQ